MGFKSNESQAWPSTPHDKLVDNDPMIVKLPMDNVDWGSRKGTMSAARNPKSGGNGRLGIKHVDGKK